MKIEANVDDLVQKLKSQFTDYIEGDVRQPELPKTKWVKEAMDMFVKLNYAKEDTEGENRYIVKYKSIKNTLEKFTREIFKSQSNKKMEKTLNNFI